MRGGSHLLIPAGAALALMACLMGCSGTPFGEGLSRSFPDPGPSERPSPPGSAGTAPGGAQGGPSTSLSPALPAQPSSGAGAAAPGAASGQPSTAGGKAPAEPPSPTPPASPAATRSPAATTKGRAVSRPGDQAVPYRVTIRLPTADPAAPAEVVTEALRQAGVPFEVESIERLGLQERGSQPAAAATPPPASTPAPAP